MIEAAPVVQWIVLAQLLTGTAQLGRVVEIEATEPVCRDMARELDAGRQVVLMAINDTPRWLIFEGCWRTEGGVRVQEIRGLPASAERSGE